MLNDKIVELLECGIGACIAYPRGDPNRSNLYPAACMAKILLDEGHEVDEDVFNTLKGGNACDCDFMKEIEEDFEDEGE